MNQSCLICANGELLPVASLAGFPGVTSDCRPWPVAHDVFVCSQCGHAQKRLASDWRQDAAAIYQSYDIYQLSGGAEQVVFLPDGSAIARSEHLLRQVARRLDLPATGRLLDFGCGNGGLLRAFGRQFPDWRLCGYELDDRHAAALRGIPGFEDFYTSGLDALDQRFDLITLIHSLEHLESPTEILAELCGKLNPGGMVLVQIPSFIDNPVDLMVMDHCSHFARATLESVAARAGLRTVSIESLVSKELTLIAKRPSDNEPLEPMPAPACSRDSVRARLRWLEQLRDTAARAAAGSSFGIFGTALTATWLAAALEASVEFFVDEDEYKTGATHLLRPVLAPAQVARGSVVYLALPPATAAAAFPRVQSMNKDVRFVLPPPMEV